MRQKKYSEIVYGARMINYTCTEITQRNKFGKNRLFVNNIKRKFVKSFNEFGRSSCVTILSHYSY